MSERWEMKQAGRACCCSVLVRTLAYLEPASRLRGSAAEGSATTYVSRVSKATNITSTPPAPTIVLHVSKSLASHRRDCMELVDC
jgi:hypothetical protein